MQDGTKMAKNFLERFTHDLTDEARGGAYDEAAGRAEELDQMVVGLACRNSVVLTGKVGGGSTALVEGLAQRLVRDDVPPALKGKRIYELNLTGMIAGIRYLGEFEERMQGLLDELAAQGKVILFIDDIHTIAGAGSEVGATDASQMLKPALTSGKLQIVGATTADEYRKRIESDPAFARRFVRIDVCAPCAEVAELVAEDEVAEMLGQTTRFVSVRNLLARLALRGLLPGIFSAWRDAIETMRRRVFTEDEKAEFLAQYLDEAEARLDLLAWEGVRDVAAYRSWSGQEMPRQLVLVENLERLPPEIRERLVRLVRVGCPAGIHVVLNDARGEQS